MEPSSPAQRRELARLERRAVAAYERELLAELRELAVVEASCWAVAARSSGLPSVELQLSGRSLVLLGMSREICAEVHRLGADGVVRIVAAGRYDRRWWIKLDHGGQTLVVLAERAYLSPDSGGLHVDSRVA